MVKKDEDKLEQVFGSICRAEDSLRLVRGTLHDLQSLRAVTPTYKISSDSSSINSYMTEQVTTTSNVAVPSVAHSGEPSTPACQQEPGSETQVVDRDAQTMVIESLRSQIQDLFTQVTQLNSKLVKSYDRVSDLEDDLHVASSNLRSSSVKISQLELERTQHLAALNTGLLVEKSHVTAELTRLMEKATEEAAHRGQAESARADIEKDLDDLSATLFDQANTMVAEARFARALSERKVEEAEEALKGAEEAVGLMQHQMQALQEEKEKAEKDSEEIRAVMGKGKWVERLPTQTTESTSLLRLRSSHLPYQEFLLFIAHLRSVHPVSQHPPAMSTLLSLPFLARLLTEDSESTVRLDLAPSLNWLSRRSVLSAIHNGQLMIEPMSTATLLQESSSSSQPAASLSSPMIPGTASQYTSFSCALCGTSIFPTVQSQDNSHVRPIHPIPRTHSNSNSTSWFKNPLNYTMSNSAHNSPPSTPPPHQTYHNQFMALSTHPQQIYIFRLSSPATTASSLSGVSVAVSLPMTSHSSSSSTQSSHHPTPSQNQAQTSRSPSTIYPLCSNGWCLARLRTTCSLWAFVRGGIVEKVWEEEVAVLPPSIPQKSGARENGASKDATTNTNGKPPIPPRRRGLWSMASALGERAASWSGDGDKDRSKEKERSKTDERPSEPPVVGERRLPPPPTHPTLQKKTGPVHAVPPPLPKRNEGRGRSVPAPRETSPVLVDQEEMKKTEGSEAHADENVPTDKNQTADKDVKESVVNDTASNRAGEASSASASNSDNDVPKGVVDSTESLTIIPGATPTSPHSEADGVVFSTPTEEVSDMTFSSQPTPSATSSIRPSDVPLPESLANTPTVTSSFAEQQAARSSSPTESSVVRAAAVRPKDVPSRTASPTPLRTASPAPARTASPAPPRTASPVPPRTSSPVPPRTSSPVPPPLPRRAAARARLVPPPPPSSTQGTVGVNTGPARSTRTSSDESDSGIISQPNGSASPTAETPVIRSSQSDTASSDKAETKDQSVPSPIANGKVTNGHHVSFTTEDDQHSPETPLPASNGKTHEGNGAHPDAPAVNADPKVEEDGEIFIGDATWEERTWKELVKLRQDMFWARVGGLR